MEAILPELVVGTGVFISALVLLVFAFGGIVLGHLADQQRIGKRYFWTDASLPEPELAPFLPKGVGVVRTG